MTLPHGTTIRSGSRRAQWLFASAACASISLASGGCRPNTNNEEAAPPTPAPAAETKTENQAPNQAAENQPTMANTQPAQVESARKVVTDPGATEPTIAQKAVAVLVPVGDDKVHGSVTFTAPATGQGLDVKAELHGLPAGKHAYHVHMYGDCSSADASSAGTHFNFEGSSEKPGDVKRITGNLGELDADKAGDATAEGHIEHASLQGAYSIIGRAVIVHEKGNDMSKPPMGDTGARIACGVIGIGNSSPEQHAQR